MKLQNSNSFFIRHAEVVIHAAVWLYILLLIWSILWGGNGFGTSLESIAVGQKIMFLSAFAIVMSANALWWIPRYLKKRKWWLYALSLVTTVLILKLAETLFVRPSGGYTIAIPVILGMIVSFAYRFTGDWIANLGLVEKLRAEKLSMELAFLKSQVDSHFLFNTLNSLYALALAEDGRKTADGIARLGTLMRYNLHDSQADFILLKKEITYIENYIELQRLRISERNRITCEVRIAEADFREVKIAPLLLIPFVENACKFGLSPTVESFVHFEAVLTEGTFFMTVENNLISRGKEAEKSGVGLENVKRRLRLLYPGKHSLSAEKRSNIYIVQLKLDLT